MAFISPTLRISLCLACIALSVFFLALTLGLVPDYYAGRLESRKFFCEQVAIHCSLAIQREDMPTVKEIVQIATRRHADLLSAGLRPDEDHGQPGPLLIELSDHSRHWDAALAALGSPDFVGAPLFQGGQRWGALEMRFRPLQPSGLLGFLHHPVARFSLFFTVVFTVACFFFVRFLLRQMNSSRQGVVPQRVRATLDNLAEGVVILNTEGHIVMANEAFSKTAGSSIAELEGKKASDLVWSSDVGPDKNSLKLPWEHSLTTKQAQTGVMLHLNNHDQSAVLAVNSIPILGDDGVLRGALASFDNLTPIEEKNADLRRLLHKLQKSRVKIQKQNLHLQDLATKDPLTGCWNRRAFFEAFTAHWAAHERSGGALSCMMVDIDHFKAINDTHGHSAGDQVLQQVSGLLLQQLRKADLVCRYGGEEFCVLMAGQDLAGAMVTAERVRHQIENLRPLHLNVTASLGVSEVGQGAKTMQEMVDQADKALYGAKRSGRNRVHCWDQAADQALEAQQRTAPSKRGPHPEIPYQAVNSLLTIINYRHPPTAEHSRRVAELCMASSTCILSREEAYLLEMAALLHDLGKLGVPDSILLKPGPLTPEERRIVKCHEGIGEDLISMTFASPPLSAIIRGKHQRFDGNSGRKGTLQGEEIPVAARILAIADAFDSMISDQVYRKRRTQAEAFEELKKHAGTQFDPDLVELFIQRVLDRNQTHATIPGARTNP